MARMFRHPAALAFALPLVFATMPSRSSAALDMVVGARQVVKNEPVSACNTKAKNTLNSLLQDAGEVGGGDTGEWKAYGKYDASGYASAAAAIHCYPVDTGYVVTFTCAVQVPPSADTAASLCDKLSAAFAGGRAAAMQR